MDHDLPLFRFAHAIHSDVISPQVFFNNLRLTNVNLIAVLRLRGLIYHMRVFFLRKRGKSTIICAFKLCGF